MRTRYFPWIGPDGSWGLIDWREMDMCRLPVKGKAGATKMVPLRFGSRASADAFLQGCYLEWARWEKDGTDRPDQLVPKDWRPRPERHSPYDNGMWFLAPGGRGRS